MTLSILVSVYNEEVHLNEVLERLATFHPYGNIKKEIILVNDGSTDNSKVLINQFLQRNSGEAIVLLENNRNYGKGFSIRRGIENVKGDIIIIRDADLEYKTDDINVMLKIMVDGHFDVVYGNRYGGFEIKQKQAFKAANKFISWFYNLFSKQAVPDVETCYKLIKTNVLKQLILKENRFGFEIELAKKLDDLPDIKITSVPIHYIARNYASGKKIGFIDGLKALWCVLKY